MLTTSVTHDVNQQSTDGNDYRPDIDGLRAVAVTLVVVFHAFPSLLDGGFVGVDVFFVISGYLITGIILRDRDGQGFSFRRFYERRIMRIFPSLALVLFATFAVSWFLLSPPALAGLGRLTAAGAAFVPNFTLWHQAGYFDQSGNVKPLLHLWSLGIEEQFYLVWPLILVVLIRRRSWVVPVITVMIAVSFGIGLDLLGTDVSGAYYSPLARAWELGIGALLAATSASWRGDRSHAWAACRRVFSYAGIALIVLSAVLLDASSVFPGWAALAPTIGAALVIASRTNAFGRILGGRWPVALGKVSYPLYLWHWPLLSFLYIHYHGSPGTMVTALAVGGALVLAVLTHRLVERPLKRYAGVRQSIALVVIMALIGGLGVVTATADGFIGRESSDVRAVLAYASYDYHVDGARVETCWLTAFQPYSAFAPDCSVRPGSPGVLIWGDSHAARLYVGVHRLLQTNGNVGQLTRSTCPPILDFSLFGGDQCVASNAAVVASLAAMRPATVILFADWKAYGQDWTAGSAMVGRLDRTVDAMTAAGVTKIVVIGPAPKWVPDLPTAVYDDWNRQSPPRHLADRLSTGLDPTIPVVDRDLGIAVRERGATYVSLLDYLCNSKGCMTSLPGAPDKLLAWDYGHLTTGGATYVARHLESIGVLGQ